MHHYILILNIEKHYSSFEITDLLCRPYVCSYTLKGDLGFLRLTLPSLFNVYFFNN